jgi:hypothetical protein
MQAATVDVLVQKGRFDPQIALAVAEAIDMTLSSSQLITVPILDARFVAFEAKMDARFLAVKAELDARFVAVDARFTELKAEIGARFAEVKADTDARFKASEAKLDAKLQKMKTDLIFWIIAIVLGNAYLPKITATLTDTIQALWQ